MKNNSFFSEDSTKLVGGDSLRAVGIVATGIHYGVYLLLNLWIWTWLAYTIGYAVSFCINYLLTNYFTFRTKPNVKNGAGFALSHVIIRCIFCYWNCSYG